MTIAKVDAVGIPSTDWERSRRFYVETLGLRPDENAQAEFWAGDTCFGIWMPEQWGEEFKPQPNAIVLLHVDDVEASRSELEAKGVEFEGPHTASIALRVPDVAEAQAELEAKGVVFDFEDSPFDTGVCHMAIFKDPDGNQLMLHRRYAARD